MNKLYRQLWLLGALCCASWVGATLPYPIDTIDGQAVYRYTVEKSIGLYRIGINFQVSQEEIIQMNPVLKERGLHYGEVIYVPVKEEVVATTDTVHIKDTVVSMATIDTIVPIDSIDSIDVPGLHIAVLLPLQSESTKRDAMVERFMEFYEGVLVALYMLPDSSHIYLHVYDVGRTEERVQKLIDNGQLAKMDAIIGAVYPTQVAAIAPLSKSDSIPTIIPFSDKVMGIEQNPFIFQFNPTVKEKTTAIGEYLEANREHVNCILVDANEADIPYAIRQIRQEIRNRNISMTRVSVHELLTDSLATALKEDKDNIVILNTEKYANAQIFLSHIIRAKAGYPLTLFSQYAWQEEKIILPQLYTSVFVANQPDRLAQYEQVYSRYFRHEHVSVNPRYDLLGYDITNQLIAWIRGDEYHGIQSEIVFEQLPNEGGYINTNVQVIHQ